MRAQITAVRRNLGRLLHTWREQAGLTQAQLAHKTGYSPSAVGGAETGRYASRSLFQATDKALGAKGHLLAAYDQASATVTAIRQEAAQQARAARVRAAGLPPPPITPPSHPTTTIQAALCPHCRQPVLIASQTATTLQAPPNHTSPGPEVR
ncbi:MAG: helix-turn-helix domain-containing protein [Streptosporangiaceae bacterium]